MGFIHDLLLDRGGGEMNRESFAWFLVALLTFLWWSERSDRRKYHEDFKAAAFECVSLSDQLRKADKLWTATHRDYLNALKADGAEVTIPDSHDAPRGTLSND